MKKRRLIAEFVALALLIVLPSAYPAQAQTPVPRQNSTHLYFQQLRTSFSHSLFSRSKFALSVEGSLITAS
jgi:hypothetical protein